MVIRNNSAIGIHIKQVRCKIRSMRMDGPGLILGEFIPFPEEHFIGPGGDAANFPCLPTNWVPPVNNEKMICGDLEWHVDYVLSTQPGNLMEKIVRYTRPLGEDSWVPAPIDAPTMKCPGGVWR